METGGSCSVRALCILNNQDAVVFSRRFPIVEKQWRRACADDGSTDPVDSALSSAFVEKLCERPDCGSTVGAERGLSGILLDLPSITGAFMAAHAIGDIVSGETVDPEVVASASPSVGGLLDSLTGSIGISSWAKPVAAPAASALPLGTAVAGPTSFDTPNVGSRPLDKDVLRNFIIGSMPFGTPLDLNYSNIFSIRANGFSASDMPPADLKQPAWKPYLYKGKQRVLFTILENIHAAMYDCEDIADIISVSGQTVEQNWKDCQMCHSL